MSLEADVRVSASLVESRCSKMLRERRHHDLLTCSSEIALLLPKHTCWGYSSILYSSYLLCDTLSGRIQLSPMFCEFFGAIGMEEGKEKLVFPILGPIPSHREG
jgi:hypothetical protein